MKRFKTLAPVTLHAGIVQLSEDQAKGRDHKLEEVKPGLYKITGPNQFKAGQEIGYDGEIPKALAHLVESPDSKDKAPAKVKKGGKGKGQAVTLDQFRAAVAKLDPTNDDHRTAAGKPDVKALKGVGVKVTAAQRDDLWRQLEEEAVADANGNTPADKSAPASEVTADESGKGPGE